MTVIATRDDNVIATTTTFIRDYTASQEMMTMSICQSAKKIITATEIIAILKHRKKIKKKQ